MYLLHGQFLSIGRTADALRDLFGLPVAAATVSCWVKRTALGIIEKVLPVIADRIAAAPLACFDETGMRTDGRLAWLHSASTSTDVQLSVYPKRGTATMDAAGVLPRFAGIAVHDAWAPYDTYTRATHALCNAHVLRDFVYVTDTATGQLADLAEQAIGALQQLNRLVTAARTDNREPDPAGISEQQHLLRSAVVLGAEATAEGADKLQRQQHALFVRLRDRHDDYLRFVTHPAVPFDNNSAEQTIRMPKTEDQSLRLHAHPHRRTTPSPRSAATPPPPPATASTPSTPSSKPPPATRGSPPPPETTGALPRSESSGT